MKRAVVFDRDGVINNNKKPVNLPEQLILFPDAAASIRRLNDAGYVVCIATNQGGVGLGYLLEQGLVDIHRTMLKKLNSEGSRVDEIAACTHAPDAGCDCRKPNPGMLVRLQDHWGFSFADSYMVGDRETDIEAGKRVGMKTVFIGTAPTSADYQTTTLTGVVDWILQADSPSE